MAQASSITDSRPVGVADMPDELLVMIFTHLDPPSLRVAGRVCRYWRRIVTDDRSWRRALLRTFGKLPHESLSPSRLFPAPRINGSTKRQSPFSWKREYSERLQLNKQWMGLSCAHHSERRLEFNARVSTIDKVIVSEKHGWAIAVSKAGKAGIKCSPDTGKVFARSNEMRSVVTALPRVVDDGNGEIRDDGSRVSALSTRIDRILWGFNSGLCTATHLNRYGDLHKRVIAECYHTAPVLDMAGPLDLFVQESHDWRASYRISSDSDFVASASTSGSVHVWSDQTGQLYHTLHGIAGVPLARVTWAEGSRYVIAASPSGVIFVWDLSLLADNEQTESDPAANTSDVCGLFKKTPWLMPEPNEYRNNRTPPTFVIPFPVDQKIRIHRIVQLTGDPFGDSFILALEKGGVWRIGVDGNIVATFSMKHAGLPDIPERTALVTTATWRATNKKRAHIPGCTYVSSRASPAAGQSAEASGAASPKGKSSESSHVLRLDLSKALLPSPGLAGGDEASKRLLLVGDVSGSLWMFDADNSGEVEPLQAWPRLHQRAVSAVAINAAVLVSAARDGQVLVIDPLSAQTLRTIRCHGGGRDMRRDLRRQQHRRRARSDDGNDREEQTDTLADPLEWQPVGPNQPVHNNTTRWLNPHFWSVHLPIINDRTRADVYLAQMLALRTSEDWSLQTRYRDVDALDIESEVQVDDEVADFHMWTQVEPTLAHGFPTLVADLCIGYGWIVVANGTRIHSFFLDHQQLQRQRGKGAAGAPHGLSLPKHERSNVRAAHIAEELETVRLEARNERERRIKAHENRRYVEREFLEPTTELGLSADEQLAYALWLSQQNEPPSTAATEQASEEDANQTNAGSSSSNSVSSEAVDFSSDLDYAHAAPESKAEASDRHPHAPASGDRCVDHSSSGNGYVVYEKNFSLEDMNEEEQLAYALFLSRTS
ncbi:hypothetical protein BX070DRAFT_233659 [Coemansia spiralis]|nr:hypothetical protein BX070DRAFT_233659 [Coemansia spiralis]